MHKTLLFSLLALVFLTTSGARGQADRSPLFGKDILLHDIPDRDQRHVAVCSAFNGWLYAVYEYHQGIYPYITFLRSKDHGITWEVLIDVPGLQPNTALLGRDIIACGNSLETLRIFLAETFMDTTSYPSHIGGIFVGRYKGEPFNPEQVLLLNGIGWYKDVELVSDQDCPADTSDPFHLAVFYSSAGPRDTVVMYSSSNGGMSLDSRKVVAITSKRIEKISAAYGRSASRPGGCYFVGWEEKEAMNDLTGHIYTAHSTNGLNSTFSTKVCIDSLDPAFISNLRNPLISAQATLIDNDSSDLTTVLLFENYSQGTDSWNIRGFYNKRGTVSVHFNPVVVANPAGNKIQPDMCFNPFDSTFMVTYFDETGKKLPFLTNSFNLTDPTVWNIISTSYNDSSNISDPNPRVGLDFSEQDGFCYWVGERETGNGMALFDAASSTYTGIRGPGENTKIICYKCFPNASDTYIVIPFELTASSQVTIRIYSLTGQDCRTVTDQIYPEGTHWVRTGVSSLPAGTYICQISAGSSTISQKIVVDH